MTIHAFPTDPGRGGRRDRSARSGADRTELALVGGLIVVAALQFVLVAVFWLV